MIRTRLALAACAGLLLVALAGQAAPPEPSLLVPHPAPEPAARTYVVAGPQPKSAAHIITPSEHLRLAAALLEEQGFRAEARRIRTDASDLERETAERMANLERQIDKLQSELDGLRSIAVQSRQVALNCRLVEIDRRRMSSPEGIALVGKHLGTEFDERQPLWPQVAKAAASEAFVREATEQHSLKTVDHSTMVTVLGSPCAVFCGGEIELDEVAGSRRARGVGLSLVFTPEQLEGGSPPGAVRVRIGDAERSGHPGGPVPAGQRQIRDDSRTDDRRRRSALRAPLFRRRHDPADGGREP